MKAINNKIVRAHKPHHCDFCGCKIEKGALYNLQFNKDGGDVWSNREHLECFELTSIIEFGDYDGITEQLFCEAIQDYIYKNHYDENLDDISEEWQKLSRYEATKRILQELNEAGVMHLKLSI